jgi:hypothetical protein
MKKNSPENTSSKASHSYFNSELDLFPFITIACIIGLKLVIYIFIKSIIQFFY